MSIIETLRILHPGPGFWYMATPYRAYPDGLDEAAIAAAICAAWFIDRGVKVFSPVAHGHEISKHAIVPATSDFWADLQITFLAASVGMIVIELNGWQKSSGIQNECKWCEKHVRPVLFIDPATLKNDE